MFLVGMQCAFKHSTEIGQPEHSQKADSLIVGIIMCDEHFDIVSIIGSDEVKAVINDIRPEYFPI